MHAAKSREQDADRANVTIEWILGISTSLVTAQMRTSERHYKENLTAVANMLWCNQPSCHALSKVKQLGLGDTGLRMPDGVQRETFGGNDSGHDLVAHDPI